jgi:hypothetical protein
MYEEFEDWHKDHHEWLKNRIESEKKRIAFYESMAKTVAQWSVIGLLTSASFWLKSHFNY